MEDNQHEVPVNPRRGAYIIPSALTTGNIFCGFFAITSLWTGDLDSAAKAIGVAIVLDGFDGRIARLMGATSKFGVQLDSLADAISFGVAPAMLLWAWHLKDVPYLGWIACFVYLVCGVMRLARFNLQSGDLKAFVGMPIPAGAGVVAATVHLSLKYKDLPFFSAPWFPHLVWGLAFFLGILMISLIRYGSLKNLNFQKGRPQVNILVLALLIAATWFFSHETLFLMGYAYLLSGLIGVVRRRIWHRFTGATQAPVDSRKPADS